jgi:hypothetical protein
MVDFKAPPLQLGGDSSISISRPFHGDLLKLATQLHGHGRGWRRQTPAVIVTKAAGMPYEKYMRREILSKLRMELQRVPVQITLTGRFKMMNHAIDHGITVDGWAITGNERYERFDFDSAYISR